MPITFFESREGNPLKVVIAGGGVAALELVLALRDLAGGRVVLELLSPEKHFSYRPLSVAEPFGLREPRTWPLAELADDLGFSLRHTAVAEVEPTQKLIRTTDGDRGDYDVLVVAIGARPHAAVPGAWTFGGPDAVPSMRKVIKELESGVTRRVAFTLPAGVSWTLPLYELALLTSADLESRGTAEAEISIVTPERRPLEVFGDSAGEVVEGLLDQRGIALHSTRAPEVAEYGRLVLSGGEELAADRVIALPRLEVPPLAGLPQEPGGFIPTDEHGAVLGVEDVYAAGDVTTFPIKQGGLASQQADVVAAAIARRAGAEIEAAPFRPVMRAVLLDGVLPRYLRGGDEGPETIVSDGPLWWPGGAASKVAGRYLAPYLAGAPQAGVHQPLTELEGSDAAAAEANRNALDFALAAAEADARWEDFDSALRWLDAAEEIGVVLPSEYADKRRRWRQQSGGHSGTGRGWIERLLPGGRSGGDG